MNATEDTLALLPRAAEYVERHIRDSIDPTFVYHNFQHTMAVVDAASSLADHYQLSPHDRFVVLAAAWFHDTGYSEGYEDHELRSAERADAWLREHQVTEPTTLDAVRGCILATRMPQDPQNFLEEIVADADLSHLGEPSYWDRCGRVRQEFALTRGTIMSDQEWIDFELNFMLNHEYKTEAGRELFGDRKNEHVRQLYQRKKALFPDQTPTNLEELEATRQKRKEEKKLTKKKKKKGKKEAKKGGLRPGRGVETMYRATYRTHVNLSSIADNKANIMLSVNAIILSISAANLFPKLDTNPHLTVPTFILVAVCLGSLFYAIQATRPKVTEGKSSREDIEARRSNLLFFGNFYSMPVDDFHYGMMEMIRDEDFLYSSMTRDLYYLGVVLAKKYHFLRICYNVFLYGLIVAVVAFIVAAAIYNARHPGVVPG